MNGRLRGYVNLAKLWTLEQGLAVAREVNAALARTGWHVGLAGSVLVQGHSTKDLDLLVFPHDSRVRNFRLLAVTLRALGWTRTHTHQRMQKHWRTKGSGDRKRVEVWKHTSGRRVDVVIL